MIWFVTVTTCFLRLITVVNAMRSPLKMKFGLIKYQPGRRYFAIIFAFSSSDSPLAKVASDKASFFSL